MSKRASSTDLKTLEPSIANFVIDALPSGQRLGESPFGIVEEVRLLSNMMPVAIIFLSVGSKLLNHDIARYSIRLDGV